MQNDDNMESAMVNGIIDDQSNATLAKPELLGAFGIVGEAITYKMHSCAGGKYSTGRSTNLLCVNSFDGKVSIKLPLVRECKHILDNNSKIPVPEIAQAYAHLTPIVNQIDPVEPSVPIALLVGVYILAPVYSHSNPHLVLANLSKLSCLGLPTRQHNKT